MRSSEPFHTCCATRGNEEQLWTVDFVLLSAVKEGQLPHQRATCFNVWCCLHNERAAPGATYNWERNSKIKKKNVRKIYWGKRRTIRTVSKLFPVRVSKGSSSYKLWPNACWISTPYQCKNFIWNKRIWRHSDYGPVPTTLSIYSKSIMPYLVIPVFPLSRVAHSCQPLFYTFDLDKWNSESDICFICNLCKF